MLGDEDDEITIRPSSTSKYPDCNRRGAARAFPELIIGMGIQLRQTPSHIGAVIGTSVHAGGAHIMKQKMEHGVTPATSIEGAYAAQEAFLQQLDEGKDISWDGDTPQRSDGSRQIDRMVKAFHVGVAPSAVPIAVEARFEGRFGPGVIVSGQMDQITVLPGKLKDLKTGKFKGWNLPQYGLYLPLGRAQGFQLTEIEEDYIKRVALKKEQPPVEHITIPAVRAQQAAVAIVNLMVDQLRRFQETQDPWTFIANPSSMLCQDRFCPAWGTEFCQEWKFK